jgi:hypothetical protein
MSPEALREKRLQADSLPEQALYGNQATLGWELSPEPFYISQAQQQDLIRFGAVLWRFMQAVDTLYRESLKGRQPAWVARWLNQGKPEALLKYGQMKRFNGQLPLVLRPDLLITESGWALCEIDAVPGGLGFTSALSQAYRQSGFDVLEAAPTMPQAFLAMLCQQVPALEKPVIAIVLSDEAADYRQEMQWLVDHLHPAESNLFLVHPSQVDLVRERLVFTDETGQEYPIDLIYRFFELFDLPNIPKIELIQYAVKKGWVHCTPPFKPHTEEKLVLALLHHPVLAGFWRAQLGEANFDWLLQWVPPTWVMDPAPLPAHGVIPNLTQGGEAVQSFEQLLGFTQKERALVIKPSGFSPLAWGSRGVTVGHDVSQTVWAEAVTQALSSFPQVPQILQRFEKPKSTPIQRFTDSAMAAVQTMKVRTRICPYYFIQDGEPVLSGVLATSCPADKKVIHGMKDAVLAPVAVRSSVSLDT